MSVMKTGDYTAQIEYSDEGSLLLGHSAGIKDIFGVYRESVDTLQRRLY
ncbi:hypothetical protein [Pseudomonas farris]